MTTNTETRVAVDSTIAAKLVDWVNAGRGVRRWVSADLSSFRPDMFTPGDIDTPPHWAYPVASSQLLTGNEIDVETFTPRLEYNGRLTKNYWGLSLSAASERKAKSLCQPGETWNWIYKGYGVATVSIGRMVITPLIS